MSSDGVRNGLIGATCAHVAMTAISATSISIEFAINRITRSPRLAPAASKRLREAGHGAAELRVGDALLLEDHGRQIRLRLDGREQHVHEALVLRQRRVQGPWSADV